MFHDLFFLRLLRVVSYERVFLNCKAHPGKVWGHAQLARSALSDASVRRERHENVMSSVMGHCPKRCSTEE